MYCVKGNSSWYISCRPLFGGCPLLGVSVIGGSTVIAIQDGSIAVASLSLSVTSFANVSESIIVPTGM